MSYDDADLGLLPDSVATSIENQCSDLQIKIEEDCFESGTEIQEDGITIKEELDCENCEHIAANINDETNSLLTPLEIASTSSFHRSFDEHDNILKSLVENIHEDIKKEMESSEIDAHGVFSNIDVNEQYKHQVKIEMDSDKALEISKEDANAQVTLESTNTDNLVDVKLESLDENLLVSYDIPQFDSASVGSSEESAIGHLEACSDDLEVKTEKDQYVEHGQSCEVKLEPELTVTETHLISNKLINTTSTITHPQDGVIESQTTRTLVMEILPVNMGTNVPLTKIGGNPEEILPTTKSSYEDSFQLNSITGDCLPLEAYGLLDANSKQKMKRKNMYYCTKCPKVCTNTKSFKDHAKVHASIEKYEFGYTKGRLTRKENQMKKEEDLDPKEEVKDDVGDLKDEKKETYKCTCGNEFGRRTRMESCLRSHTDNLTISSYSCITCSREYKNKEELMLHRKRLHRKKFPCKFCPTDYNTRKELFKHLRKHQKVQLIEFKVMSETIDGCETLKCFMCSKTYTELPDLKTHIISEHKPPYKCAECKDNFNKIEEFASHTKSKHPDMKGQSVLDVIEAYSKLAQAWKCEECNIKFDQADDFAMHQCESHTKEVKASQEIDQHQCIDCRRVFASHKSLNSHRRIHHNTENLEESGPIEQGLLCVYCRKICKDENALTSHMRFHSTERKYVCKFCDFRFATLEKRRTHAEIHTGDMKYVCFICEYTCSSENRLKGHKLSAKHLSMKEYLLTGKPIENLAEKEEKITENLREKEWDIKKKRFSEGEASNSSNTKSSCEVCGKKFSSEKRMLEHKLTHPFIEFPNEEQPTRIFFK